MPIPHMLRYVATLLLARRYVHHSDKMDRVFPLISYLDGKASGIATTCHEDN